MGSIRMIRLNVTGQWFELCIIFFFYLSFIYFSSIRSFLKMIFPLFLPLHEVTHTGKGLYNALGFSCIKTSVCKWMTLRLSVLFNTISG